MKQFWRENSHEPYIRATKFQNYPEIPFGPFLKSIIRDTDVVVDMGCGFGIPAMFMAPLCKKVIAVDQDSYALEILEKEMVKKHIENIETRCEIWPDVEMEPCDVIVSIYHNQFAETDEKLKKLFQITRREGLITCQGPSLVPTLAEKVLPLLGQPFHHRSCENGCYVKGKLEGVGFKTSCHRASHDFSQPVRDETEAIEFLCSHLKLEAGWKEKISALLPEILIRKGETLCIPILRENCIILFRKEA